ncbi:MAG: helix-turn-helix domain-containing protein [Actinomycetota bacterium]
MARRTYAQFCPAARLLDLVGERWTLLVLRELLVGPMRWKDLDDALPGIGPTLLSQRLRDLEAAGYVRRIDLPPPAARTVYELSGSGRDLEPVLMALGRAGVPLLDEPTDDQPLLERVLRFGVKSMLVTEALDDRELTVALDLDELQVTLAIGPRRDDDGRFVRFHERIEVTDGADPDADVRLTGSMVVVVWRHQRALSAEQALAELSVTGEPDAVGHALDVLGLA